MSSSLPFKFVFVLVSLLVIEVIPIQLQEGEELKENNVEHSELNDCVSVQRSSEVGVCFGKELLNNLNKYDEAESFSLANGVSFVRDEKTPRHFGGFLDKDPMDFRYLFYNFLYSFIVYIISYKKWITKKNSSKTIKT